MKKILLFSLLALSLISFKGRKPQTLWLRINQPGYTVSSQKSAEWTSNSTSRSKDLKVIDSATSKVVYKIKTAESKNTEFPEVLAQKKQLLTYLGLSSEVIR